MTICIRILVQLVVLIVRSQLAVSAWHANDSDASSARTAVSTDNSFPTSGQLIYSGIFKVTTCELETDQSCFLNIYLCIDNNLGSN